MYEKKIIDSDTKDTILPVFWNNKNYTYVKKDDKKKYISSKIAKEDFETKIKEYNLISTIKINCAYSDNWYEKDLPILKNIIGKDIKFETEDKLNLNGIRFNRNQKQIDRISPPTLNRGDMSKRKAYENTRCKIKADANSDKFIPPLIKKSGLVIESINSNLMNTLNWIMDQFRNNMNKKIKAENDKKENNDNSSIINEEDDDNCSELSKYMVSDNDDEIIINKENVKQEVKSEVKSEVKPVPVIKQLIKPEVKQIVKQEVKSEKVLTTTYNEEIIDLTDEEDKIKSTTELPITNSITETKKGYQAEYLIKKDFIAMLNFWFSQTENQYFHDSLTEILNDLMRYLNFYNEHIYEYMIKNNSLEDKVNCVIAYYNKRYENETERVEYGADFSRSYDKYVTNEYNNQF